MSSLAQVIFRSNKPRSRPEAGADVDLMKVRMVLSNLVVVMVGVVTFIILVVLAVAVIVVVEAVVIVAVLAVIIVADRVSQNS